MPRETLPGIIVLECPVCNYREHLGTSGEPDTSMLNAMVTALKEERSGALRMLKSEYSGGITATVIDASRQIATLEVSRYAHKVFSLEPGDVLGYVCDGNVNYLGTVLDVSGDTVTVFRGLER